MNLGVNDQCRLEFDNLKFRKKDSRYIIYKIQSQQIVVEKIGQKIENWQDFLNILPQNEYRFGVFDFEFKASDGRQISKLIFINWSPDTASIKSRLVYATGKQNFKKYLDLNTKDYTLNSKSDLTQQDLIKELQK